MYPTGHFYRVGAGMEQRGDLVLLAVAIVFIVLILVFVLYLVGSFVL